DKDQWKLVKPLGVAAESSKVTELLDKLASLEARDQDLIDPKDDKEIKDLGFDQPAATVTVDVQEELKSGEATSKRKTSYTFKFGKDDTAKSRTYVRVNDWARVNAVDDKLLPLVRRPALAYRGRRVLDFSGSDVDTLQVTRAGETLALQRSNNAWNLTE